MEMRGGDILSRAMRLTPKSGWDAQRYWTPSTTRPAEHAVLRPTQTASIATKTARFTGAKGILCHEKILGEEPSRVATLAPVCRDELSVMLPQISNLFWQARML